jgi:hypothetical protein
MANYIKLPDGSFFPVEEGEDYSSAMRAAYAKYPEAFGGSRQETPKKGGISGAIGKGFESAVSSGRTALESLTGTPEEAAQAGLKRQEKLGEKYADQVSLEKVKEAYNKDGVLSAAKEALGQIPAAIAEQAPQLGATLGGARAGAALGSFAGPVGTVVGGLAGAAIPSLIQQFGGNVERQAQEQAARGEPLDISRGAAAAAAIPQAALDVAGTLIPFGGRLVSKLTGIPEKALTIGTGNAAKLAEERLLTTLAKGTGVGALAEIPTEITQQMLERAQAGLSLTDQDALEEYGRTAYQVGLLAPLGAAGRLSSKAGAKQEVAAKQAEEKQAADTAAFQAAEAAATDPEALSRLDDQYRAATQRMAAMQQELVKPTKGATPEEKAAYTESKKAFDTFRKEEFMPLKQEYEKRKPLIDKMQDERQAALEAQAGAEQPTAPRFATTDIPGAAPYSQQPVVRLMEQQDQLRQQFGQLEDRLAAATPEEYNQIHPEYEATKARLAEMGSAIEERGGVSVSEKDFGKQLASETKKFQDFQQKGEFDKAKEQADKLADLKKRQALFDEMRVAREQRGQTGELFTQEQAPLPPTEKPEGPEQPTTVPGIAATPQEAMQFEPKEVLAETPRPEGYGMKPVKEAVKLPSQRDPRQLDIFSQENITRTGMTPAEREAADRRAAEAVPKRGQVAQFVKDAEKQRLARALDTRLNLAGTEAQRTATPEQYDATMEQIKTLHNKVVKAQGNASKSYLQQLFDLADQEKALVDSINTAQDAGKSTTRLNNQLAGLRKRYDNILNTHVEPARKKIEALYRGMYKAEPAAKASVVAKEKKEAAEAQLDTLKIRDAEGKAIGAKVSRAVKTAKRINEGNVTKEAETSAQMRKLADDLGRQEAAYDKFSKDIAKRYAALRDKYGPNDPDVQAFQLKMNDALNEKAAELGRQTPEYKATLKEQTGIVREALAGGKQTVASKRTAQETRKVRRAATEERTGSAESRAATEKKSMREAGSRLTKAQVEELVKAAYDTDGGTAYRTRETEGESVDARAAADFMEKVQSKLPENVKLVYAADSGKIPVRLLKQMAAEGVDPIDAMVQGAVFSDGTVLVVGDQHVDLKDLEATVLHELVGHYGIDTIIGTKRLQEYANKTDLRKLAEDIGGEKLLREVTMTAQANAAMGRSEEVQKLQVLREIIAHTEEARVTESFKQKAGRWLKELIGMVRAGLRDMGFTSSPLLSTSDVFYSLRQSRQAFASKRIGPYRAADGQIAFRTKVDPGVKSSFIATKPTIKDRLFGNFFGLAGRVQLVDKDAAISEAFKRGADKGIISSAEALNGEWLLRFGQNVSQYAQQFLTHGRVQYQSVTRNGVTEKIFMSDKGPNMTDAAEALHKGKFENDTEAEATLTAYIAGQRADVVGWDKLNYKDPAAVKREYEERMAALKANPEQLAAVKEAARIYQEYNNGLIDFLVQTEEMTKEKADALKKIPYVPFYRVDGDSLNLFVAGEKPIRIGNIKDQPELQQLVGGEDQIMPIFTSAVQNTFILTRMGLRNAMMRDNSFLLHKLGMASKIGPGMGPKGENVVRFKVKGKDHFAVIDTDKFDIPAELVVKGMEGIKTTLPAAIKLMGYPADILRKFVTRNPAYAVRQVIRDPLNAWLTTGTDATPIFSSMKELASMVAGRSEAEAQLMRTGAISSNVFSGNARDMDMFLRDISAGKSGWEKLMAKADALAMQGDAATRAVIYKESIEKGMSEQQALLRTLESMNFGRRGLSPSMQMLSTVIPFFNAQIQGLDVLYRAFKGQMPFNEQLKIKEKLLQRGMFMALGTIAYAAAMQDDEAYKRAKPEERYGNWFVYIPGFDEPVKAPIPFELGYLFKALPEAIWNMAANDEKASKAVGGFLKLVAQTNPFGLPQAVKPVAEVVLGKSFFSGDIESTREKQVLASERYRDNTTELAKLLGAVTASKTIKDITGKEGVSPIEIDYLIRGYTGGLGIALVQLANPLLNTEMSAEVAKPSLKLSKTPFIGGLFQPVEGRGTLDEAYSMMEKINQTKATYNRLVEKGERAEARAFAQENADKLALASTSGQVFKFLGDLAAQERRVRADPRLTTEQKDERLAKLDQQKVNYARKFILQADRTTRQ